PVLLALKRLDLALAVDDQADGDALDAAGAEVLLDLLPEERADLVADQAVKDAARLLGVDPVDVDLAGMLERVHHGVARDFVELDAPRIFDAERLDQVPGNRLPLAVGVGGEVNVAAVLGGALQVVNDALPFGDERVRGPEAALDIDAELALGQVAHMPHRSAN